MSVARRSTRHTGIVCAALLVAVAAAVVASLFVGSRAVPANEVLLVLRGAGTAEIRGIVWDLRVPRTLIAFAVGASLALAGALAQAWTRNPLADPGFIGITAGASCAMAIGAVLGVSATVTGSLTFAFGGAAAATGVVMLIARRSLSPLTLILAGVGVDAALRSVATLLGLFDTEVFDSMRHWVVGSTFGRGYAEAAVAWVGCAVGGVCALFAARPLDLLAMGRDTSLALGGSERRAHVGAAAGIVLLAGSATAAAGPVAFVGFAAPHIMRRLVGPQLTVLLVPAALFGGTIVLLADVLGRLVLSPGELEMSIVIAFIGAPLLIAAVHRGEGANKTVI